MTLSYGNAGKQPAGHSVDISMRLGTHVIGTWTVPSMPAQPKALFTSGRKPSRDLVAALADFGLAAGEFAPAAGI